MGAQTCVDEVAPRSQRTTAEPATVPARIVVGEDDELLARLLSRLLAADGYIADIAADGPSVLRHVESQPDLVILDLNLPLMDGMEVLRKIRSKSSTLPVLILSAQDRSETVLLALNSGADDFLRKPFSTEELFARLRALLRRSGVKLSAAKGCSDLVLHRERMSVSRGERSIHLTQREFALLEFLMRTPDVPVSREVLLREVWQASTGAEPSANSVDVYMKYLRDKIDLPEEKKLIRTVRGAGYMVSAT